MREAAGHLAAELGAGIASRYPDVTPAQNRLMTYLDRDGTSVSELARRADITKQSMHEAVLGMEERGFVERRPDPDDQRAKLVVLTEKGEEAIRVGLEVALAIHDHWTAVLGERQAGQLLVLLRRLVDRLDAG